MKTLWPSAWCLLLGGSDAFYLQQQQTARSASVVFASMPPPKKKNRQITIAELREELLRSPAQFQSNEANRRPTKGRTRRRTDNPKQTYTYSSKRKQQEDGNYTKEIAREFGMSNQQHCDPIDGQEPRLVGQIRIGEGTGSGSFAYVVDKPAGWAILGGGNRKAATTKRSKKEEAKQTERPPSKRTKQVKVVDDGNVDVVEYNEMDILQWLTPEEIADLRESGQLETSVLEGATLSDDDDTSAATKPCDDENVETEEDTGDVATTVVDSTEMSTVNPQSQANLRRIAARTASVSTTASFSDFSRPSVVAWLKDYQANEFNVTIRGGTFWTALSGACSVDDTGLLLLCPKTSTDALAIEYTEYIAVVGTGVGGSIETKDDAEEENRLDSHTVEVIAKLCKGRSGEDVVETVRIVVPEQASTSADVVKACRARFREDIRGDPIANMFDRRAPRRLIHCQALSVSSLNYDDSLEARTDGLPDDIAVVADRRNHLEFKNGSFLGRSALRESQRTNAYREINGAADGFPGWTVDRYGKWLLVSHDPNTPRGPLPSIHDGNTAGVYYLESIPDRSLMGSEKTIRPQLLEGQPAPDLFPVVENGVTYLVSLSQNLSTGLFLYQRPQRAWLSRNCGEDTRVLNCFANTGAFSVAAAAAGASTVSLDLSRKWLDRLPEHLAANNIEFDERHDCIYGDCFEWIEKLAKRNEKYDIVILDPPSSRVGQKRRWSLKNDMDELVALAAPLVKHGGVLWTTTNCASVPAHKFARMCRKGLVDAGIENAKLESLHPMPVDFPCIGTQPVKNLVWRIP